MSSDRDGHSGASLSQRAALTLLLSVSSAGADEPVAMQTLISLPPPALDGGQALERTLAGRRSVRMFSDARVTSEQLGQLLWSAQGITSPEGFRTAPSAGALYPLELFVVTGEVAGLPAAVYRYHPDVHALETRSGGDRLAQLGKAAHGQKWVREAALVVVFAAVYQRTTRKYGKRGIRYVHMEVGHAAQNLFLQAQSLGLGTVVVGAFDDQDVRAALELPAGMQPLSLMPVGHR